MAFPASGLHWVEWPGHPGTLRGRPWGLWENLRVCGLGQASRDCERTNPAGSQVPGETTTQAPGLRKTTGGAPGPATPAQAGQSTTCLPSWEEGPQGSSSRTPLLEKSASESGKAKAPPNSGTGRWPHCPWRGFHTSLGILTWLKSTCSRGWLCGDKGGARKGEGLPQRTPKMF